jgi:predicted small lipoprotein YifL
MLIIASFLLSMSGCGYKADPYYVDDTNLSDENVEFILQKKQYPENNESCN